MPLGATVTFRQDLLLPKPRATGQLPSAPMEEKQNAARGETSSSTTVQQPVNDNYPHGLPLVLIFIGLFFAALCVGLDRSIFATAIPKITTEFDSLPDVGWYGSGYLLTSCCFQLMFGKLYAELNIKWIFLFALFIFELGSVVCATAPTSPALIVGRAIAGFGASGIVTGALTIIAHSATLHQRPKFTGAIGGSVGIAQAVAPFLGGVFADYATWRWCFWINLPLGGVTFFVVLFVVHFPPKPAANQTPSLRSVLQKFDFWGTIFLVPSIVCLLLALQWGGGQYPWSNWRIVLLLCIFGVLFLVWGFIQIRQGDKATAPVRIVTMRSMVCAIWFMFTITGFYFLLTYYIPIWFQVVHNVSAYQSGINYLATSISLSLMAICSGFITSKVGYYVPQMISSTIISSIATGLITRLTLDTSTGYWIVCLILAGLSFGIGAQQSLMVPQTVLSGADIAIGTALMIFAQTISGTILLSVGENILQDGLIAELAVRAPSVDPKIVISSGASGLKDKMLRLYPADVVQEILESYSAALRRIWIMALCLSCLSLIGSGLMEWRSVKKGSDGGKKKKDSGKKEMPDGGGAVTRKV